jgi:hypothetical protein
VQLEGGAIAATEAHPEHLAEIAHALERDGYAAVNFGVIGRYEARGGGGGLANIYADALAECAAARPAMRGGAGADDAEVGVASQRLAAAAGGPLPQTFPVVHALRESLCGV